MRHRPRHCTGCGRAEDLETGERLVVVPACLSAPGTFCRECLRRRDDFLSRQQPAQAPQHTRSAA